MAAPVAILALALGLWAATRFRYLMWRDTRNRDQREPLDTRNGAKLMICGTVIFFGLIAVGGYALTEGFDLASAFALLLLCGSFLALSFQFEKR